MSLDNLTSSLLSARGYLDVCDAGLKSGYKHLAAHAHQQATAHLDWAEEIIATRTKAQRSTKARR